MTLPQAFSAKLEFLLKFLSISRSQLASELNVDKSVVGRWMTGRVLPSAHNLSRLTGLIAGRIDGFTVLDWDRTQEGLATLVGVGPGPAPPLAPQTIGLPLALMDQILATTALRGGAYEGFFRSTRPYAAEPGHFIHDIALVRRDDNGLLRLTMVTGGVRVDAWLLPLQNQLYCVGCELTSGSLVFAVLNGVPNVRADLIEGLTLSPILDITRTPTASPVVFQRLGDLTGDRDTDDGRFAELAAAPHVATEASAPDTLRRHLARDIGPAQLAVGGDWLMRSPPERTLKVPL